MGHNLAGRQAPGGPRCARQAGSPTQSLAAPLTTSRPRALLLPQYSVGTQGGVIIRSEDTRLGPARVIEADIAAGKSVIHLVDKVPGRGGGAVAGSGGLPRTLG